MSKSFSWGARITGAITSSAGAVVGGGGLVVVVTVVGVVVRSMVVAATTRGTAPQDTLVADKCASGVGGGPGGVRVKKSTRSRNSIKPCRWAASNRLEVQRFRGSGSNRAVGLQNANLEMDNLGD